MASPTADVSAVLRRNRKAALDLVGGTGRRELLKLLRRAQKDVERRMFLADRAGADPDAFTQERMRVALRQIRAVTHDLTRGLGKVVRGAGGRAAEDAADHVVEHLAAAEEKFRGLVRPMALDEAAILDAGSRGADASILRRLLSDPDHPARAGILERYGTEVVGSFEDEMRVGLVSDKPWPEVRESLVDQSPFLMKAPAHWAERILRTETSNAYNASALGSMKEANDQVGGDMVKILAATFDDRTAADSYAVHGQIRRLDEPFDTWQGPVMNPPARPNDREVVVPHRIGWPIPPELAHRAPAEVSARWKMEGRKGPHPPIPLRTTVPLASFSGKGR